MLVECIAKVYWKFTLNLSQPDILSRLPNAFLFEKLKLWYETVVYMQAAWRENVHMHQEKRTDAYIKSPPSYHAFWERMELSEFDRTGFLNTDT